MGIRNAGGTCEEPVRLRLGRTFHLALSGSAARM